MSTKLADEFFYHIYPLGLCGAPHQNSDSLPVVNRLEKAHAWLEHAAHIGATAVLLGPVFESGSHGYDTWDLCNADKRLGGNTALKALSEKARELRLKLYFDGVFHHVGRGHVAFRDVLEKSHASRYNGWFITDYSKTSPYGDHFTYESWNGCFDLVKLNMKNLSVREHLLGCVKSWIEDYGISGLRLDAADHLDTDFIRELGSFVRGMNPDFQLIGEIVKGPYTGLLESAGLDAVTNYELYKGLYSCLNDANFFELAYTLRRHFGPDGIYRPEQMYTFIDNHDVSRAVSVLTDETHLYPLYCLLFTVPGVPSVYYGSEYGVKGEKDQHSDWPLRPELDLHRLRTGTDHPALSSAIVKLAQIHRTHPALQHGSYEEVYLKHRQFAFMRKTESEKLIVAVNSHSELTDITLSLLGRPNGTLRDLLEPSKTFPMKNGKAKITLYPNWCRILSVHS